MEVALLAPFIFFMFSGALDMGFYEVSLIATQNAARVAAEYTSKGASTAADSASACTYVLDEMKSISNVRNLTSCGASPLVVTATSVTGVDGSPASSVSVTYTSDKMIAIPGLTNRLTVTRTVQMRIRS
jgi:hypothetical protein